MAALPYRLYAAPRIRVAARASSLGYLAVMEILETLQEIHDMLGTKALSTAELDELILFIDNFLKYPHLLGFWLAVKPDLEG